MPTLQVITMGCSKNTVDTEHLLFQVQNAYEIVPETEERPFVDVLAVNTCGFIGDAKEESIHTILAAAQRKKDGAVGRLVVFGCLSQRYMAELPDLIPEVDGWFGARDLDPLVRALGCMPDPAQAHRRVLTSGRRPYAFFKISEGCNRRCSYCAIPFIRGAHRSVPMEVLVREAQDLAAQGIRELVIIAQDTTYYGLDLYGRRCLAELLRKLSAVEGIEWLRIHYSYPADFPEDVLEEMAANPKVCRYMDIPLQHISDKVLENMHRGVDPGAHCAHAAAGAGRGAPDHPDCGTSRGGRCGVPGTGGLCKGGPFPADGGIHLLGGRGDVRRGAPEGQRGAGHQEKAAGPAHGGATWHIPCI